ncbi:MAG: type II toxin-antitoxin system death-on-curing family toxin [Pyrinomonadaceae bacterium]|nr:type II toxin-antitoxin system death-on-curing family toxin [Pyrinomonadaceae bacterium]
MELTAENIVYLDYVEAVDLHFALMKTWGETRFGVESRELIESALARPKHAAVYENADIIRQAATLVFGLIKNHPWTGGNKRTASFLMDEFLFRNGFELKATSKDLYEMSLSVESDKWKVDEIKTGCARVSEKL